MSDTVLLAFLVTLAAGLCTSIGSAIAFFAKTTNRVFLTIALGFSAGVMIYVSFVEIVPKALARLVAAEGPSTGYLYMTIGFFVGVLAMAVIDRLIPSFGNPHEPMRVELMDSTVARSQAQAMQLSFFFMLPNILLSGYIFPRAAMPEPAQWLGLLLPLTFFLDILRGVLLKGVGLRDLLVQLGALCVLAGTLFTVSVRRFSKTLD